MPSSLLVFTLFAVLLSLHLHTFFMFFTLVYLIFIAAYLIAFTPHDSLVRPIMEYASELWFHSERDGLDKIERGFCKYILPAMVSWADTHSRFVEN